MICKIHLLRVINPAGVENMCLNLTKLDSNNRNIAIYTNKNSDENFIEIFKNYFDEIIFFKQETITKKLVNLINKEKIKHKNKVILISWFFPFSIKIYKYIDIPILNHIGNPTHAYNLIRLIKNQLIFLNLFLYKNKKITFVYASKHIKDSFDRFLFPKKINEKIIYNGDITYLFDYKKINIKNISFAMVGRLNKIKNFKEFINFSSIFFNKHNAHQYLIIGEGEDYNKLQKHNLKNNSICRFLKRFYDKNELYDQFDILVFFNTKSEGFGNVVVEAMNRGKIVAVCDCGGPAELIKDGYDGIKFKNINDLIYKIENYIFNNKKREQIQIQAKKSFNKKFDIKEIKKKYDEEIKLLLA